MKDTREEDDDDYLFVLPTDKAVLGEGEVGILVEKGFHSGYSIRCNMIGEDGGYYRGSRLAKLAVEKGEYTTIATGFEKAWLHVINLQKQYKLKTLLDKELLRKAK